MKKPKFINKANIHPYRIRNRREAQYAKILKGSGVDYIYQPPVQLTIGIYHPDFYIINTDEYIEVIGSRQAWQQARKKIEIFRKQFPDKILRIVNPDGSPHYGNAPLTEEEMKQYITIKEAVQLSHLSHKTIYKYIKLGQLRFKSIIYKGNRKHVILREDYNKLLILKSKKEWLKKYISPTIKIIRKQLGMNQTAFAKKLGVCQTNVSAWELNKYIPKDEPTIDRLIKMIESYYRNKNRNF